MVDINVVIEALAQVQLGEVVQLRWEVTEALSLRTPIPSEWGSYHTLVYCYFHGTFILALPGIRRHGLLPSSGPADKFVGATIYTCQECSVPFWTYSSKGGETMESHAQDIPIVSRAVYNDDRWKEVTKNRGRDLKVHVPFKKFKVVCGIKPTMEPDP